MRRGGRGVQKPFYSKTRPFTAAAPPTLAQPANQTNITGEPVSLQLVATNTTSFTTTGIPSGVVFNTTTGKFTGTPTTAEELTITVTAHGPGGEISRTFEWRIVLSLPPTLYNPGNQLSDIGSKVNIPIESERVNTFTARGLPSGLSINETTGEITGSLSIGGTYHVHVTGRGFGGTTELEFEWIVRVHRYEPEDANNTAQEIYSLVEPLTYADQSLGYPLMKFIDGIGLMWDDLDQIVRDKLEPHGITIPGWSKVMTLEECPDPWLPWLAQFIGVTAPSEPEREAEDRELILGAQGMRRGTPAAIRAAVQPFLTGKKRVDLFERSEGKAYKLTIVTYISETPNQTQVENLLKGEEVVPAGIVVDYKCVPGWIYQALAETGKTYNQLKTEFGGADTYQNLVRDQP